MGVFEKNLKDVSGTPGQLFYGKFILLRQGAVTS
jgi:hypothetical protein